MPSGERLVMCRPGSASTKWQLALDMVDELGGWGLHPPVVVTDAGYGESGELRLGLEARGLAYVVQVKATISAYPEAVSPRSPLCRARASSPPRYHTKRSSLAELVLAAGPAAAKTVAWREGTRGKLRSRFVALGSARPG